jgi:hypothetical protein
MVVNAIWRARTEAGHGKVNSCWNNWIVEDCLTRIGKLNLTTSTPTLLATMFISATSSPLKLTLAALQVLLSKKLLQGR